MTLRQSLDSLLIPFYEEQQYNLRNDLNILYINPEATGGNFYKIFVPYWVLKSTQVVNTALLGWSKYNPYKRFRNEEKTPINSRRLLWADVLVFPFTNQNLTEFFERARAINNNIRLVYHVDFDFLEMPNKHPLKDAFNDEKVQNILKNIIYADRVIVSNNHLATYLVTKMQEMGYNVDRSKFAVQLLCYDDEVFLNGVNPPTEKDPDHFNLVVLAGDNQISDIETAIPMIKEAKKKHGNSLKITFFGANKNKEDFQKMVKGLEYVPEKATPIWAYYNTLANLNANAVIIPSDGTEWTQRSSDYKRFIDCAMLNFPIITPNFNPYKALIKDGENGFAYTDDKQFLTIIDELISDKNKGVEAGRRANDTIQNNFFYNTDKLQRSIDLHAKFFE